MSRRRDVNGRARGRRTIGMVSLCAALALVTAACGLAPQTAARIDAARTAAGRPTLPSSPVLNAAAQAHAQAMCAARAVSASPPGSYAQETAVAVHELVGAATLDGYSTGAQAVTGATNQVWAQWHADAQLVDPRWTDMGVGVVVCADHELYLTAVLRQRPTIPASGRYSTPQHSLSSIRSYLGIQYATSVDDSGATVPLLLDVYTPPATAPSPRPAIVLIHGGAFVGGSRTEMVGVAQQWAVRGYDAIAIDYRLDQTLYQDSSPPKEVAAATNATSDAEQAVRWMKANAATYGIDVARIAAVGDSAGGAISLGMSAVPDFQPSGPYSSTIAAAVSTGAYLTPALDLGVLHLGAGLAPILMFHYETDVASNTGEYAFRTCSEYRDAGSTCDYVSQPGEGHTTDLTPGGVWWSNQLGPFIWQNLHLGG